MGFDSLTTNCEINYLPFIKYALEYNSFKKEIFNKAKNIAILKFLKNKIIKFMWSRNIFYPFIRSIFLRCIYT